MAQKRREDALAGSAADKLIDAAVDLGVFGTSGRKVRLRTLFTVMSSKMAARTLPRSKWPVSVTGVFELLRDTTIKTTMDVSDRVFGYLALHRWGEPY